MSDYFDIDGEKNEEEIKKKLRKNKREKFNVRHCQWPEVLGNFLKTKDE